jgi:ribosomal protein L11 methyltransferase
MGYIEVDIKARPKGLAQDILVALLADAGFEMFEETDEGLRAYIPSYRFSNDSLIEAVGMASGIEVNWNEEWEKSFEPVVVKNCCVRAPFHKRPAGCDIDIVIEPKMSFGTGHHETTALMIEYMLGADFHGKRILDMGSGTGILSILASRLGAAEVLAVDIDPWAFENGKENIERNQVSGVTVKLGDAGVLDNKLYNIILANINRNIITRDIYRYSSVHEKGGTLVVSGFLDVDSDIIVQAALPCNYRLSEKAVNNHWTLLAFTKEI